MRHREFEVSRPNTEPVTFTIKGQKRLVNDGEVTYEDHAEDFTCLERPMADALFIAAAAMDSDGKIRGEPMKEFIAAMLVEEDETRFRSVITDKSFLIPPETLAEIATWIAEMYGGRPTSQPSGSPAGLSQNGDSSTEGSPLEALVTP